MEDTQVFQMSKILIASDHFHLIASLSELLSRTSSHLRLIAREQAIAVYNKWLPDLVIVDLQTRCDHGIILLAQLKSMVQDIVSILALTGRDVVVLRQEALMQGAKDVLALPCDAAEARARVRNLLELRHLHQRLGLPHAMLAPQYHDWEEAPYDAKSDLCQRLTRLIACRDRATGMHAMRMSRYAAVLARAAGLSAAESDLLRQASPLHDIGKIAIPDRILLKPAPLEPDEWAMIQTHTTIGAELLAGGDSALLRMAHDTALTHHEKWDGSGLSSRFTGSINSACGANHRHLRCV